MSIRVTLDVSCLSILDRRMSLTGTVGTCRRDARQSLHASLKRTGKANIAIRFSTSGSADVPGTRLISAAGGHPHLRLRTDDGATERVAAE
jgi:hypothetical protein